MSDSVVKAGVFLLVLLGAFLWIGKAITDLTGGEKTASAVVEVSPEGGEAVYWGKGRCFTCHSMGDRGSAVRGPNHGQFGERFPLAMGERAVERAKARSAKTGKEFTAVDYLVESLSDPGVYVVTGYKNEMAVTYAPPISLNLDEIKAVVSYLQIQGGDLDMVAIDTEPSDITKGFYDKIGAAQAAGGGDPGKGAEVFADNCSDCHMLNGEGGEVGPKLTGIAAKGLKHIDESIRRPAAKVVAGFEYHEVVRKDGRKFAGLKTRDEADEIDITKADGDVVTIAKAEIKEIVLDKTKTVMPSDLIEALTVKDFQDVLSFLMLQKAPPAAQQAEKEK
ncbi:MAG: c-type cytochrome [Alphaproteobacteria bacterium]|jgi:putative heme-binding domain-containing protein|nr:c-type cytochrome [Alphaproteobacteria bacterium]